MPGVLKNAIDWASRPWGQNSFDHMPAAVIGASPSGIGTAVAQQELTELAAASGTTFEDASSRVTAAIRGEGEAAELAERIEQSIAQVRTRTALPSDGSSIPSP